MSSMWAQRREELLSDCLVSPEVFTPLIDRLGAFVVPYQHALATERLSGNPAATSCLYQAAFSR